VQRHERRRRQHERAGRPRGTTHTGGALSLETGEGTATRVGALALRSAVGASGLLVLSAGTASAGKSGAMKLTRFLYPTAQRSLNAWLASISKHVQGTVAAELIVRSDSHPEDTADTRPRTQR